MSNVVRTKPAPRFPKRLYTVRIETEIVVLAEDLDEAEEIAEDSIRKLGESDWSTTPSEMAHLPCGWEDDGIPFGEGIAEDPDRTVKEWIQQGAAPKYTELVSRLSPGPMQ